MPGYQAPQDTIAARVRDLTVLAGIVRDAWQAGAVRAPEAGPPDELEPDTAGLRALMPEVPDAVIWRAVTAWTATYGWVSFEVFGQFNNTIEHRRTAFGHSMLTMAETMGLAR